MEHRWSKRHSADFDIRVCVGGQEYRGCTAENISSGGLFARIPDATLARNSIVEVVFEGEGHLPFEKSRVSAMVAHSSTDGAGLTFGTIDESVWLWLKERTMAQSDTG